MDKLLSAAGASNVNKELIVDISSSLENNRFTSDESYDKLCECVPVLIKFKDDMMKYLKSAFSNRLQDVMEEYVKFIYSHLGLVYESYDRLIIKNGDMIKLHITANRQAKVFEGLADYQNTVIGNGYRTDADKIVMCDEDYGVVELHKSRDIEGEFPNIPVQLIVFRHNGRPYDGMKFIPYSTPVVKFPTMKDALSEKPFIVNTDQDTLCVSGECTIKAEVPVVTQTKVTIMGTQGSILHLINTEAQQPCIGPVTRTGMSGGRWCPEGKCPTEIIIDGVHVICESRVDGFTIGQYGDLSNTIPKITLVNGGKLTCPEMEGERVIIREASAPEGSTKISDSMAYAIRRPGQSDEDMYPQKKKELIAEVESIIGRKVPTINLKTSERALSNAVKWLRLNPNLNPDFYLNGEREGGLYIKKCMMLLRMPDELFDAKEIFFEMYNKHQFIVDTFYGGVKGEFSSDFYTAIKYLASLNMDNDYIREVMYDMIPAYEYHFKHNGSHYDEVVQYLSECGEKLSVERLKEIDKNKDKIVELYSI